MIRTQSQAFTMSQFDLFQNTLNKAKHSIAKDPLLVNIAENDLRLKQQSPCIDAGENIGLEKDIEDNSIPQRTTADIGAYELP